MISAELLRPDEQGRTVPGTADLDAGAGTFDGIVVPAIVAILPA